MGVSRGELIGVARGITKILQNLTDGSGSASVLWEEPAVLTSNQGEKRLNFHLTSNCCADRRRNGFAEALHIRLVLGFDHHASQRLGARIAQHDPPVVAKR